MAQGYAHVAKSGVDVQFQFCQLRKQCRKTAQRLYFPRRTGRRLVEAHDIAQGKRSQGILNTFQMTKHLLWPKFVKGARKAEPVY